MLDKFTGINVNDLAKLIGISITSSNERQQFRTEEGGACYTIHTCM